MLKTVENFLKEYNIKSKRAIVAFSGGSDSCALSLALNYLKKQYDLKLVLAYFNHGWRNEADKEEDFTKDFAKKIDAEYCIEKAEKTNNKTEEQARILRYEFLERTAKKFNTDVVFLAHNKNDNIETLVYRLIKGTSIKGLTSIPKNRGIFFRPILEIEKKEILHFLKMNNQNYMTDISNENTKYKRNLIRKKILPLFEEINPNYINNIDILIKTSIASKKIIDSTINDIEKKIIKNGIIDYNKFIELDKEIRYEIINNFLGDKLKYRDYKNIKKFDDFIINNKNSKTSINKDEFLTIKKDKIYIEINNLEQKND